MELQRFQQLARQYVERTREEVAQLQKLVTQAQSGNDAVHSDALQLAHRIHGTGALLGFNAISAVAAEVEAVLRQHPQLTQQQWQQVASRLLNLSREVDAAAVSIDTRS